MSQFAWKASAIPGRRSMAAAALLLLLLLLLFAAWLWFSTVRRQETAFTGFVQGELIFVGTQEGGRLADLLVAAGQEVKPDQTLFTMDSAMEQAARDEAGAALSEARARLARALAARELPEQVEILRARERKAQAALAFSESELTRSERSAAAIRDRARARRDGDRASLDEVRQQIVVAGMSARAEDIEAARAEVAALEAKLSAAQIRLDRRQVKAQASGIVQEIYFRNGEIVPPGRPVASLLPLENVIVRFFSGEAWLPKLAVGDAVIVRCDGCDNPISARIRFISPTAEFTPPIIYSNEERSRLVFMVEAVPELPKKLRPGQPVTVSLPAAATAEHAQR